jgi:transposase InsO family protein
MVSAVNSFLFQFLVATVAGFVNRSQQDVIEYLREENRVLREQVGGRRLRLTDDQRRRLAVRAKALGRAALHGLGSIVTPDTLLGWYRKLVAAKYNGAKSRRPGRPPTRVDLAQLVVTMAQQNSGWGYTRIRGALANLGHEIGRNTIKRILADAGIEPAPERGKRTPWKTFLKAHWGAIAAADFFTVEVLTSIGLVRYFVMVVIDLKTRRVQIAGVVHDLRGRWVEQIARNLTDPVHGFLNDARYLIHDRDPVFTRAFRKILQAAGVKAVRLPARSPNLNAYCERFILSVKGECLRRMIPLGKRHLELMLAEYLEHYHQERNHQGLGNRLIENLPANDNATGPVRCRERLGGVLNFYHREAA